MDNGYVETAAQDMLSMFLDHVHFHTDEGVHYLTSTGWGQISSRFDEVFPNERATVFVRFLELLDNEGIKYDITQFSEDVH